MFLLTCIYIYIEICTPTQKTKKAQSREIAITTPPVFLLPRPGLWALLTGTSRKSIQVASYTYIHMCIYIYILYTGNGRKGDLQPAAGVN